MEKADTIHHSESSRKCVHCGLRNFLNRNECLRCKSDLSRQLNGSKGAALLGNDFGGVGRSTSRFVWILAALVTVLLGLVLVHMRQSSQGAPVQVSEAVVQPATQAATQPAQEAAEQNSESEAAASQMIVELRHFQDAAESGVDYDDYDKNLNRMKSDLNSALTSFTRHDPNDEIFRQEVAGALRDYSAAGNWWKTTVTYSSVFTEADRNERTQRNWASARTHLTNAEKSLAR